MSKLAFRLHSAGVLAPGIDNLDDLKAACRIGTMHEAVEAALDPTPQALSANERRRASHVVRLTLACIEKALRASPFEASALRSVFAADEGTGEICQQMLESLATTRQLSPLLFSNSVLNAPSGYFSIGHGNRQCATVVSGGLESFAAGLVSAVTDAHCSNQPVLFVCYDPRLTAPMDELVPIRVSTASAWVISSGGIEQTAKLGDFVIELEAGSDEQRTSLPSWIPRSWSGQASAGAFAALGLLEREGARLSLLWNGLLVHLRRATEGEDA